MPGFGHDQTVAVSPFLPFVLQEADVHPGVNPWNVVCMEPSRDRFGQTKVSGKHSNSMAVQPEHRRALSFYSE